MSIQHLLVTGDFVRTGGMDRANYALADYLARQGQVVHLVAHRIAPELLSYPNVRGHVVPKPAGSYFFGQPLLDYWGRHYARQIGQKGRVVVNGGNCRWGDTNWVHYVHAAYQPLWAAHWRSQFKGKLANRWARRAERHILPLAQRLIVNSNRTRQHLIDLLGIASERIHTVYYGIDPYTFYPATPAERLKLRQQWGWPAEQPVLVFIGALGDRRKGFDTLWHAWKKLCNRPDWSARLVVIGTGAELATWQQKTKDSGLIDRLSFLGLRHDVPDFLRAADGFVAPTRYEAYGLAVHEALCCGLPALVSAQAGVAERYPSHCHDWLIPNPDDVDDLAQRLHGWQRDRQAWAVRVAPLTHQLRQYTWDHMAHELLATIDPTPS